MTTQLSLYERILIEKMLRDDYTFASIARKLNRSAATISREILRFRCFVNEPIPPGNNDCTHRLTCRLNSICKDVPDEGCYFNKCKTCPDQKCFTFCTRYESSMCERLNKPPYVCSNCPKEKQCSKNRAYYTGNRANSEHHKRVKLAHQGLRRTPEEIAAIGEIITPLIKKGQSPHHICATHGDELGISERTLYNYIDASVFTVRNIDLPKKVAYRKRRQTKGLTKLEYRYRKGRTYSDFKDYIEANPTFSIVEMDTVKGKRNKGQVLLTMIFRKNSFMLIFLMPDGTQKSVLAVFDFLTKRLGVETFNNLFTVILTDNGVEFKDVNSLEYSIKGYPRTRMFYCDPQASWQKPQVENNHKLIRRILPKHESFNALDSTDVKLITCHINSVVREQLGNCTPFDLMTSEDEKKLLSLLELSPIPRDDVLLKPTLLKQK